MRSHRWAGALGLVLLLAFGPWAFAQDEGADRIAQVDDFTGQVQVKNARTGELRTVTRAGPKIRNSAVYSGDEVLTGADGTCSLLFPDGSVMKLETASTDLLITEGALEEKARVGRAAGKTSGRRVKVVAGTVRAIITPQTAIYTEFETPSGVAGVKGTTLTVTVANGIVTIRVENGSVVFSNTVLNTSVDLLDGQSLTVSYDAATGRLHLSVASAADAPLNLDVGGTIVHLTTGDGLDLSSNPDGSTGIRATDGTLEVTNPDGTNRTLEPGQSMNTAPTGEQQPPGGTPPGGQAPGPGPGNPSPQPGPGFRQADPSAGG